MKKKSFNIMALISMFLLSQSLLFAQEENRTEISANVEQELLSESADNKQCSHDNLKLTSNKGEDRELISLRKRVKTLEDELNPLLEKMEIMKTLIHNYEINKAEYEKEVNWNLEELF